MIRKADVILGIVLLILGGAASAAAFLSGNAGAEAVVSVDGAVYCIYDLAADRTIDIDVDGHHNQLRIQGGKAVMTEADCPDQYCLRQYSGQGGIDATNETIVCLPNKVIVTVTGDDANNGNGVDAVVN